MMTDHCFKVLAKAMVFRLTKLLRQVQLKFFTHGQRQGELNIENRNNLSKLNMHLITVILIKTWFSPYPCSKAVCSEAVKRVAKWLIRFPLAK